MLYKAVKWELEFHKQFKQIAIRPPDCFDVIFSNQTIPRVEYTQQETDTWWVAPDVN